MKFVPNAVTRKVAMGVLKTQKNSPTILFGAGVIGVVTSTVLACKATLKLEVVLEDVQEKLEIAHTLEHSQYSEDDRKKDLALIYFQSAVAVTKLYGPAIIVGGLSIAALTKSHNILSKRNAALSVAFAGAEKALVEYRGRVAKAVGEERESDIYHDVELREVVATDTKGKDKIETLKHKTKGSMYAVMYDEMNPNWQVTPEYNDIFLRAQQTYANNRLRANGHLMLNDIYRALGFQETSAGCVVGWVWNNGDNYVDFGLGDWPAAGDYTHGREHAILLDFNVDGVVYDLLDKRKK